MRIVAGTWRGRTLVAPPGQGTRPTADRVRQALFDMLMHAEWGGREAIEGAAVLDVFAGTGALGLEALSRGAATGVFHRVRSGGAEGAAGERGGVQGGKPDTRYWRAMRWAHLSLCHGRAWPGHPRLRHHRHRKSWMAGPSPAMTQRAGRRSSSSIHPTASASSRVPSATCCEPAASRPGHSSSPKLPRTSPGYQTSRCWLTAGMALPGCLHSGRPKIASRRDICHKKSDT